MNLAQEIRIKWKPRPETSHKGDFGRIFILAGSRGMAGAAYLAATAALRTGAGLVALAVPESIYPVWARRMPEVLVKPFPGTPAGTLAFRGLSEILKSVKDQDVLAAGPGLSRNRETQKLIRALASRTRQPFVLDADGLNAFAGHAAGLEHFSDRAVLTPHPGEFKRLFGGPLGAGNPVRKKRTQEAAKKYGLVVVLKGSRTVVSDGSRVYVNPTGNPGMATGGTGDVLTGMVAALIGQGFSLWDAARFGVYLHGLAGDLAAKELGEAGLIAGDLIRFLPAAIRNLRGC